MTEIIKYKSLHIVNTFSWKKYYIDSSTLELFKKEINDKKFITIWESVINTSSIDTIDKANSELNRIESVLINIDPNIAERIRQQIKIRQKENEHKTLTDWVLEQIILKFNK